MLVSEPHLKVGWATAHTCSLSYCHSVTLSPLIAVAAGRKSKFLHLCLFVRCGSVSSGQRLTSCARPGHLGRRRGHGLQVVFPRGFRGGDHHPVRVPAAGVAGPEPVGAAGLYLGEAPTTAGGGGGGESVEEGEICSV